MESRSLSTSGSTVSSAPTKLERVDSHETHSENLSSTTTSSGSTAIASDNLDEKPENISIDRNKQPEDDDDDDDTHGNAPDGGYSWVVAIAALLINTFSWGINSSFGVFLNIFLKTDKYHGTTPIQFAFVGGITFGIGLIMSPFITWIVKTIGCRPTIIIGSTFQCLGLVAASFTTEYYQLFLSQGVLQGVGLGMVFFPPSAIIPQWFDKNRALATGIATAGTGLGGIIFSLSVQRMVQYLSVEWIQRICGLMCLVVCVVCALFIKTRDDVVHPHMDFLDKKAFNQIAVFTLLCWGALTMMGYEIFLFSMANFSTSIGLTSSQGSAVSAVLNAGVVVGRPFLGHLMDRFGRFNFTLFSCVTAAILSFAMWIPCKNYATAIALAFLAGTQVSGTTVAIPPLATELVGLKHLPPLLAASWTVMGISTVFGEPIVQAITDDSLSNPFLYCQVFTGLCFAVGAVFLLVSRARRVDTIKAKEKKAQLQNAPIDETESVMSDEVETPRFFKRLFYPMKV